MRLNYFANPSVVSEATEFSLTAAMLVAMLLFLGSSAFHYADVAISHAGLAAAG
jgi:hypothetical protein